MATLHEDPNANMAWHIWVGTITTLVPATLAVILRLIARYISSASCWWDDYTIVLALVGDTLDNKGYCHGVAGADYSHRP